MVGTYVPYRCCSFVSGEQSSWACTLLQSNLPSCLWKWVVSFHPFSRNKFIVLVATLLHCSCISPIPLGSPSKVGRQQQHTSVFRLGTQQFSFFFSVCRSCGPPSVRLLGLFCVFVIPLRVHTIFWCLSLDPSLRSAIHSSGTTGRGVGKPPADDYYCCLSSRCFLLALDEAKANYIVSCKTNKAIIWHDGTWGSLVFVWSDDGGYFVIFVGSETCREERENRGTPTSPCCS